MTLQEGYQDVLQNKKYSQIPVMWIQNFIMRFWLDLNSATERCLTSTERGCLNEIRKQKI